MEKYTDFTSEDELHITSFHSNNIKDIANEELNQKKIPFMLLRTLPNKAQEYWRISDMIIPNY